MSRRTVCDRCHSDTLTPHEAGYTHSVFQQDGGIRPYDLCPRCSAVLIRLITMFLASDSSLTAAMNGGFQ